MYSPDIGFTLGANATDVLLKNIVCNGRQVVRNMVFGVKANKPRNKSPKLEV